MYLFRTLAIPFLFSTFLPGSAEPSNTAIQLIAAQFSRPASRLIASDHSFKLFRSTKFWVVTELGAVPAQTWLVALQSGKAIHIPQERFSTFVEAFNRLIAQDPISPSRAKLVAYLDSVFRLWQPSFTLFSSLKAAKETYPSLGSALTRASVRGPRVSPAPQGHLVILFGSPLWEEVVRYSFRVDRAGAIHALTEAKVQ